MKAYLDGAGNLKLETESASEAEALEDFAYIGHHFEYHHAGSGFSSNGGTLNIAVKCTAKQYMKAIKKWRKPQ